MTLLLMLLLKSLLVFALSGMILLCLRRASASARHLVCLLTLAALLALPLFSLTLPGWHVAGFSSTDSLPPAVLQTETEVPPAPNNGRVRIAHSEAAPIPAEFPVNHLSPAPPLLGAGGNPFSWPLLFLSLYVFGVALASLRPLLGLWGIAHLRRACVSVTDAPTLSVAADCAAALRLTRRPQLCRADVPVPMTWGWRRPVVLLPSGSETWPEDRLKSVLLHEMAHLKRLDWSGHRLADAACALYWFHPLVWLVARRLRAESEIACDDLVLSSGIAAPDYARHLLEIAGALPRPLPSQSAIAMAQTPHIKGRILMILDSTQSRRILTRRALLIALIPSAASLLTLAALRPSVKAQATSTASADATSTGSASAAASSHSALLFLWPGGSSVRIPPEPHGGTTMLVSPNLMTTTDLKINGTTLFAGMTSLHSPGSEWWSASGTPLQTPVYDTSAKFAHDYAGPLTQNIGLAFRLPPSAQGVTVQYKLPESTGFGCEGVWPDKSQSDAGRTEAQMFAGTNGARIVSAAFPPTLRKISVQVGIASGAWTTAVSMTKTPGAVEPFGGTTSAVAGSLFILTTPDETAKGLLLTLTTNSTDDIRVVAIDNQGQILLPTDIGGESSSSGATNLDQIKAHFSQPISQIKEFRVETRPFQWIEFKDVALQPVK